MAPASCRRFCFQARPRKSPAGRRRHKTSRRVIAAPPDSITFLLRGWTGRSTLRTKSFREPVNDRQENVEATGVMGMMQQMVPRRRAQQLRKPTAHVRAPVNIFKCDVVHREAGEYSSGPAVAENPLQQQKWRGICKKKRDDSKGVTGKIDIPGRFRGIQCRVVNHVLLAKNSMARVQNKSV